VWPWPQGRPRTRQSGGGLLGEPVDAWPVLVGRVVAVSVVTTALVLALRRVPLVQVVL
jgi:hypothetical protein